MKTMIYYTEIPEKYRGKRLEHLAGEKLLELALKDVCGRELRFEPRGKGEHGKPFFTLLPNLHYNISHSGDYVVCAIAEREVGIDIQEHRDANYEKLLKKMVDEKRAQEILSSAQIKDEFYNEWARKEAYIKWTGEGLSRRLTDVPGKDGICRSVRIREGYSCVVCAGTETEPQLKQVNVTLE